MKFNATSLVFAAIFTSAILSRVVDNVYLLRIAQVSGIVGLFAHYKYSFHQIKVIGGVTILVVLFLLKIFLYEEAYLTGLFTLSVLGSGLAYYKCIQQKNKFYLRYIVLVSYVVIIYLSWNIIVVGIDSNELIRGSRNYITTLCLALSVGIIIGLRSGVKRKAIKLLSYIVIYMMNIFIFIYTGRTGIAISLGVTYITLLHISGSNLKIGRLLISILILGLFLLIGFSLDLHEMSTGWNRLQEKSVEGGVRILIWGIALQYMLDPSYFMGVPEGLWTQLTGYSSHNSFIFIYSNFGWPGLILVAVATLYCLVYLSTKDKVITALMALMIFRSFFDLTLLSVDLGPFFILCILLTNSKIYKR